MQKLNDFIKKYHLPVVFTVFFVLIGFFYFFSQHVHYWQSIRLAEEAGCFLNYGKHDCVDGNLVFPFYNQGVNEITFASITLPVKTGFNIYSVEELLEPNTPGTLSTSACDEVVGREFVLKWCCGEKCFETAMNNPDPNITLVR